MHEISIDRRIKDRYATDILARCFIKSQSLRFEDCTIVNLSRSGAAVRFAPHLQIEPGMEIDLEITVPPHCDQITLKTDVMWYAPGRFLGGIRFSRLMDELHFGRLISLR